MVERSSQIVLAHDACSLAMQIPAAMASKPLSKLLARWVKEYEKRQPAAAGGRFRLEHDGAPLALDGRIGSLPPTTDAKLAVDKQRETYNIERH